MDVENAKTIVTEVFVKIESDVEPQYEQPNENIYIKREPIDEPAMPNNGYQLIKAESDVSGDSYQTSRTDSDEQFCESKPLSKLKQESKAPPEKCFKCSVCNYRAKQKGHLRAHMFIHTGEKPHKCNVCDMRFTQKPALNRHVKIHTGEKNYQCAKCALSFNRKHCLERHILTHSKVKRFVCDSCDFKCVRLDYLYRHQQTHLSNRERPFTCQICTKTFSRNGHLRSHLRIHTQEKPFGCTLCDFRCSSKSYLPNHMRVHTGEKPFECDTCDYKCAHKCSLLVHKRTHVEQKECNE